MSGNSNDNTNFPYNLLFTNTQLWKIRKAFANGLSANKKKIQKTKLSKIVQLWGFVFGPLNVFGSTIKEMMSSGSSIKNSFAKELNIKDLEDIDSKLFLDTGLDIIGKNFEKEIASITGSGITLTNNYKSN